MILKQNTRLSTKERILHEVKDLYGGTEIHANAYSLELV